MLRNSCVTIINKRIYVNAVTNIDKSIDNQALKIDRESSFLNMDSNVFFVNNYHVTVTMIHRF